MTEKGKQMCKVEFIESYIRVGNDYQWNDNHGELIRCKNCRTYDFENSGADMRAEATE